jgi:hypothetical protein
MPWVRVRSVRAVRLAYRLARRVTGRRRRARAFAVVTDMTDVIGVLLGWMVLHGASGGPR